MKRYIRLNSQVKGSIDYNRLRSSADKARTQVLYDFMDNQEHDEEMDYLKHKNGYIHQATIRYAKQFEELFKQGIEAINDEIDNVPNEVPNLGSEGFYNMFSQYAYMLLLSAPFSKDIQIGRFSIGFRDSSSTAGVQVIIGLDRYFSYNETFCTFSAGKGKTYINVTDVSGDKFCNVLSQYCRVEDVDPDDIYETGAKFIDAILDAISDIVTDIVEWYISDCPPMLE